MRWIWDDLCWCRNGEMITCITADRRGEQLRCSATGSADLAGLRWDLVL